MSKSFLVKNTRRFSCSVSRFNVFNNNGGEPIIPTNTAGKGFGSGFGEPKFPSIDEKAKQIQLGNALKGYKDETSKEEGDETKKTVFADHMSFPTEFTIKVIGI
jgi:hypothetical protein